MTSSPRTSPVIIAVVAAVVTWIAAVVATVVGVQNMDLVTVAEVVIFAVVTTGAPAIVAVSVVGFIAGQRDRRHEELMVKAAAAGAFGYLALSSVMVLLSGDLQIGVASLVAAGAGGAIGGAIATLLLARSSQGSHAHHGM